LRSIHPLTYSPDSPQAMMHGFINLFVAAAFTWHGTDRETAVRLLEESDPDAFRFTDDALQWDGHKLSTSQVVAARSDFAHSFGSCSFEEPVAELRTLGWLP